MRLPRLALDLDGVVVDFFSELIEDYNKKYQATIQLSDINGELENLGPEVAKRLIQIFNEPGWFLKLQPLPNAISTVSRFSDLGYKTVICTAPARDVNGLINGNTAAEKFDWIRRWLPFWTNDVIITKHKSLVDVDMLIDDAPYNIVSWCNSHSNGIGFLVDRSWNKSWDYYPRNSIRGNLEDVSSFIYKFWCQEREIFSYKLGELQSWKK